VGTLSVWSRCIQGWRGFRSLAECVSGTLCAQAVSMEVVHIFFEMVGVCLDCSMTSCVDPEETLCIEF